MYVYVPLFIHFMSSVQNTGDFVCGARMPFQALCCLCVPSTLTG